MKRRDAIKTLSVLPIAGFSGVSLAKGTPVQDSQTRILNVLADRQATGAAVAGPEIYTAIGVEPVINCRGTFTIIGGSAELPEVKDAIHAAANYFVQYDELAEGVGQHLANLTGAEWGMVSSGCAAGMKHVTVACVTGGNPEKLIQLPDITGFDKTEVIIPRHSRNQYDHAIRNVGVRVITVETMEELKAAIGPQTAMIYLLAHTASDSGPLSTEAVVAVAKPLNVPVLVDAAAEDLTIPNVHLARGADVVTYSGGKVMCGPQGAGLVLGKKSILKAAWQSSAPHHGIGRNDKVGREETLGMVAAVEAWTKRDHSGLWQKWLSWLDTINKRVSALPGITTEIEEPTALSNHSPTLTIRWDAHALHVTGEEFADELAHTKPRIALEAGRLEDDGTTSITITAFQMQEGNDRIVADRIHELLRKQRAPKPKEMAAPAYQLGGRWDVTIHFFHGESTHAFHLEQDGNWISGIHQGDFHRRELMGSIEGNAVKFRSVFRRPGDSLVYSFSGNVSDGGDRIEGNLHMGEYLECTFTASKHRYPRENRRPIKIPVGPPLAT